jgi:hypothetical protein
MKKQLTPNQIKFLIGFVSGGCAIVPLLAFRVDASLLDAISNWSASYGGSVQAQDATPIPVPQDTPPIGRDHGTSIAPCAAPPPTMASTPDEMPTSPGRDQPIPSSAPVRRRYQDMKTKILMNTLPGNKMRSLISRVGYPHHFDKAAMIDYYTTHDGTIAVKSDRESDRVVSIQFVR